MNSCSICDKPANLTCIIWFNTWYCSRKCYIEYAISQGRPTYRQFYYMVEQQKNILHTAKEDELKRLPDPFA